MEPSSPPDVPGVREMPPRGFYSAAEVGRLAGVSGNTIGQWNRHHYIKASRRRSFYPHIYSYQDIGEAMIVHDLIVHAISRRHIKRAIEELRAAYGYDWPLSHSDFVVADFGDDQRRSLVIRVDGGTYDVTHHKYAWQAVFDPENIAKIAWELSRGGWAARELPELKHIEVNPNRLSGRPAIRGTRVFAEHAAQLAATTEGREELRDGYELNDDQIDDAVKWFGRVAEYEAA